MKPPIRPNSPDYPALLHMVTAAGISSQVLEGADWHEVRAHMVERSDEECAAVARFDDDGKLFSWSPGDAAELRRTLNDCTDLHESTRMVLDQMEPIIVSKMVWATHAPAVRDGRPTIMSTLAVYVSLELIGLLIEGRMRAGQQRADG